MCPLILRPTVRTHPHPRRGFTLIEAALVTAIIGVGVVGMLQLLAAGTMSNASGAELTTGMHLARSIRELALGLAFADPTYPTHWGSELGENIATYDDIDDLNGKTFSPPIDARRQRLYDYAGWAQSVTVQSVDTNLLTAIVPNGSTPTNRVTVVVTHNGKYVCDISWLAFDASSE